MAHGGLTCKFLLAYRRSVGDVFKALADPTRRAILDELVDRDGQTLFELCTRLTMKHGLTSSRQAISQHLDVLADAGLVSRHRQGRYTFHQLDTAPLGEIARLVALGVRFTQEPLEMGPVVTAVLDDTCGNLIQIASMV